MLAGLRQSPKSGCLQGSCRLCTCFHGAAPAPLPPHRRFPSRMHNGRQFQEALQQSTQLTGLSQYENGDICRNVPGTTTVPLQFSKGS